MTELYHADFLFYSRPTHRAWLCQSPILAGILFAENYPAIAPESGIWQRDYNALFLQSGKTEIWLAGSQEWVVATRQQCFPMDDPFTVHLIPIAEDIRAELPVTEFVKRAWAKVHPPKPQKPPMPRPYQNGKRPNGKNDLRSIL